MLSLLFCFRPEIILKKTLTSEWPEEFHWNFFENMYLMIILEATKKQVFAVSLEYIFLEKQERSQIEAKWNQINCLLWNLEFDFTQICWIWYWWPLFFFFLGNALFRQLWSKKETVCLIRKLAFSLIRTSWIQWRSWQFLFQTGQTLFG